MSDERFSSLANILNRPNRTDPTEDHPEGQEPATITSLVKKGPTPTKPLPDHRRTRVKPAADHPTKSASNAKSEAARGGVRRVAFRLQPQLHQRLAEKATSTRTSRGQIVLDAIEDLHTQDKLAPLVTEANSAQDNGLFPRLKDRGEVEPSIPVEIKIDARAALIIDQLVTQLQAESRTQLITEALGHYLPSAREVRSDEAL